MRVEFFLAEDVGAEELEALLRAGWRTFGHYYFRPTCPGCRSCVPIRIRAAALEPTRSQRRTLRRNLRTEVRISEPEYREEIYRIYEEHSLVRFGKKAPLDEFLFAHYCPSCPALQSEYYIDGALAGVGFLTLSNHGLSSVYFVFHSRFARWAPGVYSVFAESRWAVDNGLDYYYLGYWIAENRSMRYKADYGPHELMNWASGKLEVQDTEDRR